MFGFVMEFFELVFIEGLFFFDIFEILLRKDNFLMGINLKDFIIKLNIGEDSFSLK